MEKGKRFCSICNGDYPETHWHFKKRKRVSFMVKAKAREGEPKPKPRRVSFIARR